MNMWRVGEDMGSKETDGCPLTLHQDINVTKMKNRQSKYPIPKE
jgi:hypothetical protein